MFLSWADETTTVHFMVYILQKKEMKIIQTLTNYANVYQSE